MTIDGYISGVFDSEATALHCHFHGFDLLGKIAKQASKRAGIF